MTVIYALRRSTRARALRLAVYPGGEVVVTAPHFFGQDAIERFVATHSLWAKRKAEEMEKHIVIRAKRADIPSLKLKARAFAVEKCRYYAARYGVTYMRISIRAQKARWGSCSKSGNLSFNYKLALLPPRIAEYIIVHEICHLAHLDHSRAFWALVARTFPDHAAYRRELRRTAVIFS